MRRVRSVRDIHPDRIAVVNDVSAPNPGVDGQIVDRATHKIARDLLARTDAAGGEY